MKEECLVPNDRATDRIAVDIPLEGGDGQIGPVEEVLRIQFFIPDEFKGRSMDRVCALFGNRVDDDSRIAPIFGAECVGLDFELLNTFDIRLECDLVLYHVAQVNTVEQVVRGI